MCVRSVAVSVRRAFQSCSRYLLPVYLLSLYFVVFAPKLDIVILVHAVVDLCTCVSCCRIAHYILRCRPIL